MLPVKIAFAALFLASSAFGSRVVSFSPLGESKEVSQVKVRFSEDMIALGDPRGKEPFDIRCLEAGTARWVDTKNWVYEFEDVLGAGVECFFTLKPGTKTLAGKPMLEARTFQFSTGGPHVERTRPWDGEKVAEDQIFAVFLDAVPNLEDISKYAVFTVSGIATPVGVNVVTGALRQELLTATQNSHDETKTVLLQPKTPLAPGSRVALVWDKRIRTATGVANQNDQVRNYEVRPPFQLEFSCDRENPEANCTPFSSLTLNFSSPIVYEQARKVSLVGPGGKVFSAEKGVSSNGTITVTTGSGKSAQGESFDARATVTTINFTGPFPANTEYTFQIPSGMKDETGRPLTNENRFPLKVKTDGYPPLAKFAGTFGVVEYDGVGIVPVTLRKMEAKIPANLRRVGDAVAPNPIALPEVTGKKVRLENNKIHEILYWLKRVSRAEREHSVFESSPDLDTVPATLKPSDFALPARKKPAEMEVIGVPFKEPGFYVLELKSAELGKALLEEQGPMYVPTAVLVTGLAVHFKWAQEKSAAWVTELKSGKPVKNAKVEALSCDGKSLASSTTDSNGIAWLEKLPLQKDLPSCRSPGGSDWSQYNEGVLVTATQGKDMAFVHSSSKDGIEPWRFDISQATDSEKYLAHTVLDRTLLRAGETVHAKHFLRLSTAKGLEAVPEKDLPATVQYLHGASEQKYEFPLTWKNGAAETNWKIPKSARLGQYTITYLPAKKEKKKKTRGEYEQTSDELHAGSFRVEEFRVPLLRATLQGPTEKLVRPKSFPVKLSVTYLAGGGASKLPVRFRYQTNTSSAAYFDDFEGFPFSTGGLEEFSGRVEDSANNSDEEEENKQSVKELTLDQTGAQATEVSGLSIDDKPATVQAEFEYPDANGEIQTVSQQFPVFPADRLVALKIDSWTLSRDRITAETAVVDPSGKPLADVDVAISVYRKKSFSHRKRLVGGFYAYENFREVKKLGPLCVGKTGANGKFACTAKPPESGNLGLVASVKDSKGRVNSATQDAWVAGDADWWFHGEEHDRMDLIADKKRYEPGESAKIQVRSPFRQATALVAIERSGITELRVQEISGKEPVIEVPIKGSYAPNVYVSVLAVRGRANEMKATATADMGRPAFKLGITSLKVGWKEHELKVAVNSDRDVYQVREKAKTQVKVLLPDGNPAVGSEVVIAAVDEGLLELSGNSSWNLLSAMMATRGYGIETATLQMHVIGKRHFGVKAAPVGGDGSLGASGSTREMFDTLLLWKARLLTNENGIAEVDVPLNDSITSFKLVAIASAGTDKFGTGAKTIRATQDLMVLPGIPPVAREGDQLQAMATVRNTTARPMEAELTLSQQGTKHPTQTLKLPAGESREIAWAVTIPTGAATQVYELTAVEKGGKTDKVRFTQNIKPAIPTRVLQSTIAQWETGYTLPVAPPKDAVPGAGGVQVVLSPKLASNLEGVRTYMKEYPYSCLEQQTSKAIALKDKKAWEYITAILPSYLDNSGLAKYFPSSQEGSDVLTSYLLSIAHEAGWKFPKDLETKMLAAMEQIAKMKPGGLERNTGGQYLERRVAAMAALARYENPLKNDSMQGIEPTPQTWPTTTVLDWVTVLENKTTFPNRQVLLANALDVLRSRTEMQGTIMGLRNVDKDNNGYFLMASRDANAVRLLALASSKPEWKDDVPRLARGVLALQRQGHWDLTTANAWGVLAMEKFSRLFESEPVKGTTEVSLGKENRKGNWEKPVALAPFVWPATQTNLTVAHQGSGKPWITTQTSAAIKLLQPLSAGFRLEKKIEPLEQKNSGRWSRGDLARIQITVKVPTSNSWVVVMDPIPTGASILGTGLGRDSALATQGEETKGWVWPVFKERTMDSYRAYYDGVPQGDFTLEYTIRLNNEGQFALPPTRVEAMYSPEQFAETPNNNWAIGR